MHRFSSLTGISDSALESVPYCESLWIAHHECGRVNVEICPWLCQAHAFMLYTDLGSFVQVWLLQSPT